MSIVRYTNKKTGTVTLYESTSYYDPVKKQSRPKRKYLGIEDPVTKELIPSSGKRGRKKGDTGAVAKERKDRQEEKQLLLIEELKRESSEKEKRIKELEAENRTLRLNIDILKKIIS